MRITRNDQVLAAALAILLTTVGTGIAAPQNSDVKGDASATGTVAAAPSDADLNSRIPLPDPLNVPPPSSNDVASPVPTLERKNALESVEAPAAQPTVTASPEPVVAPAQPAVTSAPQPVATPEPAVTSAPTPATTDTVTAPAAEPIVDQAAIKLKEIITTKLSRFVDRKDDRAGVESFYAARQYAPLWTDQGVLNARGKAAIAYLAGVSADGLDPSDYPVPAFKAGADPQAIAEAELKLTDSVITFARHAQNGRVHFSRISGDILYNLVPPDTAQVLANVAQNDVAKALDSYTPQHDAYKALKAKLAELRGATAEPAAAASAPQPVHVPEGAILRVGDDDSRVAFIRKRLAMADQTSTKYDKQVAEAVKDFQRKADLDSDGSAGRTTVRAMNNSGNSNAKPQGKNSTINTILANMERWRWMPRDLGKSHVVLNIPAFTLKVMSNGNKLWETRVVVGKPNKATPLLTETMKYITVNPTWNVPPSIVYGEYLPALQQDPSALDRIGIKVAQEPDGSLRMYQPPGDGNALGRIRFNFPNKFLVYQHDTPDKHLFAKESRAFSHGCMRVQDPLKYGEVLLSIALPKEGYTVERLRKMYGPEEREIPFPTPIPVHITYQTAVVEDGKLIIRDDVYGLDAKTLAVLKGDNRQIADIPMDRRGEQQANYARPPVNLPYGVATEGSQRYASRPSEGGNFFEMLFGGPRYYQQQPQPRTSQVDRRRGSSSRPLN
jgi:murein L,D-transpeptidase YcbB/YkuD